MIVGLGFGLLFDETKHSLRRRLTDILKTGIAGSLIIGGGSLFALGAVSNP